MTRHDPNHKLGEPHASASGWYRCTECHFIVCGTCRRWDCTCGMTEQEVNDKELIRLMRAGRPRASGARLKVAEPDDQGLVSVVAPDGAQRPEKGRTEMSSTDTQATPAEAKVDKRRDPEARRGKGQLEALVKSVTDAYDSGQLELGSDEALTPHRIATFIGNKEGQEKPSGGAVAAVLARWDVIGYALTNEKPFSYRRATAAGQKQGLDALKAKHHAKVRAERAAAKAAQA
jgi:hypothetical protein